MFGEAIRYLKTLPRDMQQRADSLEALVKQIQIHSKGMWNAVRGPGMDGSQIFLGRQGEGLVIAPDGGLSRGVIGAGLDITPNGLSPQYGSMKSIG